MGEARADASLEQGGKRFRGVQTVRRGLAAGRLKVRRFWPSTDGMMRRVRWLAVLAVVAVLPLLVGSAVLARHESAQRTARLDTALKAEATSEAARLQAYFSEARKLVTYSARTADFTGFYEAPGTLAAKVRGGGVLVDRTNDALAGFERLYPDGIGEACFIDRAGTELARVTHGERAPVAASRPMKSGASFFSRPWRCRPARRTRRGRTSRPTWRSWSSPTRLRSRA